MCKNRIIVRVVFFAVILCIAFVLVHNKSTTHSMPSVSFEELYNNGNIALMGLDETTTKAEFEERIGMSYWDYLTMMDNATINNNLEPYTFLFEGIPVVCLARFEDETLRNLIFDFWDEDAFLANEWVRVTESLIQKLKDVSEETIFWRYTLPNAKVSLELSSGVDAEGEKYQRVSEMWITYTDDTQTFDSEGYVYEAIQLNLPVVYARWKRICPSSTRMILQALVSHALMEFCDTPQ